MNFVEPIRNRKKIAQIKNLLRGEKRFRNLLLFTVGINIALRISDLLRLRVEHFLDAKKRLRRRFWIREEKRGKRQEVVVNDSIRTVLTEYLDAYPDISINPQHFIFFNTRTGDYSQPIKRGQAWKFITTICQSMGLRGNFGTHSLRNSEVNYAGSQTQGVSATL
jgi:integrase